MQGEALAGSPRADGEGGHVRARSRGLTGIRLSTRAWKDRSVTPTDSDDIDHRSALFVGLTPENLSAVSAEWPRTRATPPGVAGMLAESRRLFVGASQSFDNFVAAPLKALQAADLALKLRVGFQAEDKRTMGKVIVFEREKRPVLSEHRREWYTEFALHFRNKLSHPYEAIAFSPGMSAPMLKTVHEAVAELFPDPCERDSP